MSQRKKNKNEKKQKETKLLNFPRSTSNISEFEEKVLYSEKSFGVIS